VFRNPREHARAYFLGIVKGKDNVGPSATGQNAVRAAGLTLDRPADAEKGGKNAASPA
jgi:hypothetical protein